MKWILRIFGSIIGLFGLGVITGIFLSPNVTAERSIDIFSQPDDIFIYLENLQSHQIWSPWYDANSLNEFIAGGADTGIGQKTAWTCLYNECRAGTETTKVVHYPEFVQTNLNLDGFPGSATYALSNTPNEDGSLTVLIKVEFNIGNFPYIQRLFKFRRTQAIEKRLDRALQKLSKLLQEEDNNTTQL